MDRHGWHHHDVNHNFNDDYFDYFDNDANNDIDNDVDLAVDIKFVDIDPACGDGILDDIVNALRSHDT